MTTRLHFRAGGSPRSSKGCQSFVFKQRLQQVPLAYAYARIVGGIGRQPLQYRFQQRTELGGEVFPVACEPPSQQVADILAGELTLFLSQRAFAAARGIRLRGRTVFLSSDQSFIYFIGVST